MIAVIHAPIDFGHAFILLIVGAGAAATLMMITKDHAGKYIPAAVVACAIFAQIFTANGF